MPFPFEFARLNALQAAVRHSHTGQLAVVNVGKRQSHVPADFLDAFWHFELPKKIGFLWSPIAGAKN
jgi:hypothetical protein